MKNSFKKDLEKSRVVIYGVKANEAIMQRIAPLYPIEEIDKGVSLYKKTKAADEAQDKEQNDSKQVTISFGNLQDKVISEHTHLRKALRFFYKDDTAKYQQLNCMGEVPNSFAERQAFIGKTIKACLSDEAVIANISIFNFSKERVELAQTNLVELDNLRIVAEREDGEAQQATADKQRYFDELTKFTSRLKECLSIFYHGDDKQILEQVGIVVR